MEKVGCLNSWTPCIALCRIFIHQKLLFLLFRFFFFPKDLEMELEPWAVEGMHSSEEVHVSHVQANELFTGNFLLQLPQTF